MQKGKLQLTET